VHAASALSGVTVVCVVKFDTHFQRHASSDQTATDREKTPAASLSVLLAANCCGAAVMCTRYNVSQL